MSIFADLQIHSRFSRATSNAITLQNLEKYARLKGINLLGTGDFTHPKWLTELKSELKEDGSGILTSSSGFKFVLQGEISNIYTQDGKVRKIHTLLLARDFDTVEQINQSLLKKGRLDYDGRPIFGFSCIELVEMMKNISDDIEIIPAHAWTPYFGIFGSMSGFDSVEECFKDQARHIHAIETGLSCYDKETEVLTENGWKKFTEVNYSDKICTLNVQNDEIELQKPTKIHSYYYKGRMYRLKTKRVDLLVTPNHKLLYSPCDFRKSPRFYLQEADFLFRKSKRFKKDGKWNGKNEKYFILPAVKVKHGSRYYSGYRFKKTKQLPIRPWLKFFGFWIAEGWVTEDRKNGAYAVCIANRDNKLLSEIKNILESFGYNVYWDKKINDTIRIRDYQLFQYLKQFGKSYDKFIPLEVKCLSIELLKIFFEYYIKGDGHIYGRTNEGLSATTISEKLRDDLQEIALKMGFSAYYKLGRKKGAPILSLPKAKAAGYEQSNDAWIVFFIRKNLHTTLPSTIKKYNYTESWIDFDGSVFCVNVPNHVIYIRRNGIPVWCGNSDPSMNWRLSSLDKYTLLSSSDAHSFWPWRLGRECNVFEFNENYTYDDILNAIRKRKGFVETIEMWPHEGKYHYTGHRNCNVCMSPKESLKLKDICPKCGSRMTVGVAQRVEMLADRPEGFVPKNSVPFRNIISLSEVIAGTIGERVESKKVWEEYYKLVNLFGNEFEVLLNADEKELFKITSEKIANNIIKNRNQKIPFRPGYDGVYGVPVFDGNGQIKDYEIKVQQKGLDEFM